MARLTKSQYELIAQTIADECRATLSVYRMTKHRPDTRQDLEAALQKAWSISLALSNRFAALDNTFDRPKFLEMTTVSPQNWRHAK